MQIPTQVSLEWSRCPDGYEIVPQDGDPLEPAEVYVAIIQRDPQNASALAGLARCYLRIGDVARADQIIGGLLTDLANPAVKRAFREVRRVQWALLGLEANPERTSLVVRTSLAERTSSAVLAWTHRLKPRTTTVMATRPLDDNPGLYRQFAALAFEPNCYRKFADGCGLLTDNYSLSLWSYASFHACVRRALGLAVPPWVQQQFNTPSPDLNSLATKSKAVMDGVGMLIVQGSGDDLDPLVRLKLLIERGCTTGVDPNNISGRLEIVIRPRNLMVAIALQTVWHLSGEQQRTGVELIQCERCNKPIMVGTGTGRRTTLRFCSPKCGQQFRYAKKKSTAVGRANSSPDKARTSQE
jgi:hypothetical protein